MPYNENPRQAERIIDQAPGKIKLKLLSNCAI
jgi:hypothetical protein